MIDGKDLKEYNIAKFREQIGYVMQEPVLFNETIKNNILYGKLDATDEEVWYAALQANALSFIDSNIENLEGEEVIKKLISDLESAIAKI